MDLATAGILIILAGVLALVLAAVLSASSRGDGGQPRNAVKSGGVILIGPIPIIFGSDAKWASVAIVLAIVLIVLSVLFTFHGGL